MTKSLLALNSLLKDLSPTISTTTNKATKSLGQQSNAVTLTSEKERKMQELIKSLIKAKKNFEPIVKDTKAFNYKYATLDQIISATSSHLADQGLTVIQFPISNSEEVGVETILAHESGDTLSREFTTQLPKRDPQSIGSALTYFRRYGQLAVLGLAPEDDDGLSSMPSPVSSSTNSVVENDIEQNPGDYRLTIGKFKGMVLSAIPRDALINWYNFMKGQQQLGGPAKEAVAAIDIYLND